MVYIFNEFLLLYAYTIPIYTIIKLYTVISPIFTVQNLSEPVI